jgi:hypothetical protein
MEISAAMIKPGWWIAFQDSSIQERGLVWGRVITQKEASRRKGYVSPSPPNAVCADSWDIDDDKNEVGWLQPESIVRLSTERDGPALVPVYCASCEETTLAKPDFLCSECRELQLT